MFIYMCLRVKEVLTNMHTSVYLCASGCKCLCTLRKLMSMSKESYDETAAAPLSCSAPKSVVYQLLTQEGKAAYQVS